MTLRVTHSVVTGAAANPDALVDGVAWDAAHTVSGLGTGVETALAIAVGTTGSVALNGSAMNGTTTNDSAAAGVIGEYISSTVPSGSAVSLTANTPANMTSISLTAGDWDVELIPGFTGGGTTTVLYLCASISQTSATLDQTNGRFINVPMNSGTIFNSVAAALVSLGGVTVRLSLANTTTIYAVVQSFFSISTCTAFGVLRARRVR